ncbi:MAG: hypothetical protein A3F72_07835 [Bacteroidetes bacterium RIFCSPLOWO2_12_FULL_35_15]|nr:MAG: hypothetical protein A3F72_07835 [Bacteroidetes bacterium RIFCSPLOWO2_12_FULL_35_15]
MNKKVRNFFSLCFILAFFCTKSQTSDSLKLIRIHIIHGSKPKSAVEYKTIGGMYGGHVVIETDSCVYGFFFDSKQIHVFPHKRGKAGVYEKENLSDWKRNYKSYKITSIEIPIFLNQYEQLIKQYEEYIQESPHDYAFFGMRCASSCYWVLGTIGVVKKCSKLKSMHKAFHPKAFRKKMQKLSQKNGYVTYIQKGRSTRKWEND